MDIETIGVTVLVNAIVVAVGYGATKQELKDVVKAFSEHKKHDDEINKSQQEDHDKLMKLEVEVKSNHSMLPECFKMFDVIRGDISEIKGKVSILSKINTFIEQNIKKSD